MRNKRVTRSSANKNYEHMDQFQFQQRTPDKELQKEEYYKEQSRQKSQDEQQQWKEKKRKPQGTKPMKRSKTQHIKVFQQQQNQNQEEITLRSVQVSKLLPKKKMGKKQNEGLRIIEQRETENLFKHLCNHEGKITVESLGRMMVRAKKDFQIQDIEKMIGYWSTIKRKMQQTKEQEKEQSRNMSKGNRMNKKDINRKVSRQDYSQRMKKRDKRSQNNQDPVQLSNTLSRVSIISQDSEANFQDELDQSDKEQQISELEQQWKTQLNLEQFRLIKEYFDR